MPAAAPAKRPRSTRRADRSLGRRTVTPLSDVFTGLITLADAVGDAPRTSWIQLFKTGKFWDPRYGTFSITPKDLAQIYENFKTVTPEPPYRLPIDYNHGTSHPNTAEEGKAAGWITDLSVRGNGEQLWGLVEWTEPAAEMIAAKEYQFVSPTFAYDYTHSNGEDIGTTLLAAAITNRPVLEGMEPLTLSQHGTLRLADGGTTDTAAMFSFDEQRRRVQAELSEAFGVAYGFGDCGPCAGCYLVDLFDGRAIYRQYTNNGSGDLFEVAFEITADGDVHFTGTPTEVVADYRRLSGEQQMAKTITVKDAKGNDVNLSEEVVLSLARDHAPAPAPAAPNVELAKQVTDLSVKVEASAATILELTAANAALKKDAHEKDATARVDKLVAAGKVTPADRDETITLAIESPAAFTLFEKQMAKRPAVVAYGQRTGSETDTGAQSASDEVIGLARVEQDKDKTLSSAAAMERVFRANPELYARYTTETAVKV